MLAHLNRSLAQAPEACTRVSVLHNAHSARITLTAKLKPRAARLLWGHHTPVVWNPAGLTVVACEFTR